MSNRLTFQKIFIVCVVMLFSLPAHAASDQGNMADKYEPDNTWQNANIIWINGQRPGQQYEWYQCHNFYHSGDVDWVKFYAVKGEWYTIDVKDVGANADPVIGIYDKDGQTLLKEVNNWRSGEPEQGTFICPANGVYYARISQCEKEGCNIAYGEETEYTLTLSVPVGPGEVMIYGYVRPAGGVKDCEISTEEESLTFINGFYSSAHPTGTFTLTAKADHYKPFEKTVLIEDVNKQVDIILEPEDDADQDKDGMLDLWEEQYGLNLSVNDASGDPDGDGITHYKEYMLGSDPANPTGYLADDDLWIRAVIYTVEKGPIEAVWKKGGEGETAGDHRVIWGYFHASPSDVDWGNPNNPDLFVKIWFDASGRTDVNYFHVSVPAIEVYSDYPFDGVPDEQGSTTTAQRYIRQYYKDGLSSSEAKTEDGNPPEGYSPTGNPSGNMTINNLRIGSVINTVEKGPIEAVWRFGGQDDTDRGDQVVWGHFYASPDDVDWGSPDNPDLFVKIWFDAGGRTDVNFFHVSVPDIEVYSDYPSDNVYDQKGTSIMNNRYVRHEY